MANPVGGEDGGHETWSTVVGSEAIRICPLAKCGCVGERDQECYY